MHMQSLQWFYDLQASSPAGMWEYLRFAFSLPGNLFVELIGLFPTLANLLGIAASPETGYASFNGVISKIVSCAVWLFFLIQILNLTSRPKRPRVYLDEDSKTQPLMLPMPKDYPVLRRHSH